MTLAIFLSLGTTWPGGWTTHGQPTDMWCLFSAILGGECLGYLTEGMLRTSFLQRQAELDDLKMLLAEDEQLLNEMMDSLITSSASATFGYHV